MKIVYFTHFDLLRPTTNRISDIRFCEGFAENGCEVEMVTPYVYRSYNIKRSDILTSYGIEHSFRITMLPTPFWEGMSKWINVPILTALMFLVYLRILLTTWGRWSEVVVLSRDVNCLLPVLCVNRLLLRGGGPQVVHWAHEIKEDNPRYRWVYREADGVIGTNTAIVEDLAEAVGLPRERMAVTLNPVSTRQLEARLDKRQVRERLGLSMERPLIVYTGKVGVGNEEIEHILSAASCLPEYMFLFTGGSQVSWPITGATVRTEASATSALRGFWMTTRR